jgi:hypothetical protein
VRAVIDEAWANGEFGAQAYDPENAAQAFAEDNGDATGHKLFNLEFLSLDAYDEQFELYQRAAALLGEKYQAISSPEGWFAETNHSSTFRRGTHLLSTSGYKRPSPIQSLKPA